ncbi:hypothetical protein [Stackebrandtia soli]|uniref:hypothetical protein n=1 Tax=Stackebrandtia soli TaxID=1892856 RepID=UPI0039E8E903
MSIATAPASARTDRIPGWIIWTLRPLTALIAVGTIAQPVVAGLFITGNVNLLVAHLMIALALMVASLLLLIGTILYWRPGRGSARPILRSGVLFVLILGQSALGAFRILELHFPLAFVVGGVASGIAAWAWAESTRTIGAAE